MPKQDIGEISYIPFNEAFNSERDFSSWLGSNIDKLGEKLGLSIIDSSLEDPVGNYYCDITAYDSDERNVIIIENQLGATNHDHLGKILTYASGKDARIIVWVAEQFREEHQKALEWINERSDPESGISFFGVQLRIIRIKDSQPAVVFDIVVKPNDWERSIRIDEGTTDTNKKYYVFFEELADEYSKIQKYFKKPNPKFRNYMGFRSGKTGLYFSWVFNDRKRFSIELYLDSGDKERNESYFDDLEKNREQIDGRLKEVGIVSWERLDDRKACRIAIYRDIKDYIAKLNQRDLGEIRDWGTKSMKKFTDVMTEYISKLNET